MDRWFEAFFDLGPSLCWACLCAITASRSERMEILSAGGPGWQVLKVSNRQAGGGFSTLAGQKIDEWGHPSVLMWISWPFCFRQNTLLWHQRTYSLGCQHEL